MTRKRNTSRKMNRKGHHVARRVGVSLRRLTRNAADGSISTIEQFVVPALGATGGILLAQWLGSKVGPSLFPGQDSKLSMSVGSTVAAYAAYMVGDSLGLSQETQMTVAAGAGVVGILPWLPQGMLPSVMSEPVAIPAPPVSGYYQQSMLSGGLMVDVSHAGAPYKGMFGLGADPSNQDAIDSVLQIAEGVSLVEPIDAARKVISKRAVRPVTEQMGTPGDRGWAGGTFGRTLFSGMLE